MANHYELLGVPPTATAAEVRQAYLRLAREHHPDRFADPLRKEEAQELFKQLTSAFNTLFSEGGRREYDASLARPRVEAPIEIARRSYEEGVAHFEAKRYHEAVELLRAAVHHMPDETRYQVALALALAKNPNWGREAIALLEKAVVASPRAASWHAELSRLYLAQGLKLRARKEAEATLALDPDNAAARRVLAEVAPPEPPAPKAVEGGLLGRLRRNRP